MMYIKKYSDWLRAVQFKGNTSANYTLSSWIMIDWKPRKFSKPIRSHKMRTKICAETLKKVFSNEEKWLPERSSGTSSMQIFFNDVYIINNIHEKIFLDSDWLRAVQFILFNLICTCEFFKKLKLHSLKRLVQFQLFQKLMSAN